MASLGGIREQRAIMTVQYVQGEVRVGQRKLVEELNIERRVD
jgi:hypothetical protein